MVFDTSIKPEWQMKIELYDIADCLKHLRSAQKKLEFSFMDINFSQFLHQSAKDNYSSWNEELMSKGNISGGPSDKFDYWGMMVPIDVVATKLTYNFINSLHSFFDIYARFLFYCINKENPRGNLYFDSYTKELIDNFPDIKLYEIMNRYKSNPFFRYIYDFDNSSKHETTLAIDLTIILNDGQISIEVPEFVKAGRSHSVYSLSYLLEETLEFIINFYNEVTDEVFIHLSN